MKKMGAAGLLAAVIFCGCASSGPKTYTGADGVSYREEKHVQGVWLAQGFNFNGYDTVYVAEPVSTAESRSDEERQVLAAAKRNLRQELINALQETKVFGRVTGSSADASPSGKALVLENNIYHHEKGGGGARYFAGLYGAGQPVIKVRGTLRSGDQPLFRYEMTRSGESAGSRLGGVFMSDENIQTEDIKDLAKDLAAFIESTAKGLSAD